MLEVLWQWYGWRCKIIFKRMCSGVIFLHSKLKPMGILLNIRPITFSVLSLIIWLLSKFVKRNTPKCCLTHVRCRHIRYLISIKAYINLLRASPLCKLLCPPEFYPDICWLIQQYFFDLFNLFVVIFHDVGHRKFSHTLDVILRLKLFKKLLQEIQNGQKLYK